MARNRPTCRTCTRPPSRSPGCPTTNGCRRVRADRWIGYTRATEALARLETLIDWPARQRMPNLLLIGPTNNGKSMIIEKFRRTHPPVSHPDREHIPVLAMQMPSEPSVIRFYVALLAALGAPLRPASAPSRAGTGRVVAATRQPVYGYW